MTIEKYFLIELSEGKIDFHIRAHKDEHGVVSFYIHPQDKNGLTRDYRVVGNELTCITEVV